METKVTIEPRESPAPGSIPEPAHVRLGYRRWDAAVCLAPTPEAL